MRSRPLLVALLLLAGCTKEATRPSSFTFVGTWTLISINGSPVPYNFSLSGYPAKVGSGSLVVRQDSTASFTSVMSSGYFCSPQSADSMCAEPNGTTLALTWVRSGDQLLTTVVSLGLTYSPFTRVDDSTITRGGSVAGTETYRR